MKGDTAAGAAVLNGLARTAPLPHFTGFCYSLFELRETGVWGWKRSLHYVIAWWVPVWLWISFVVDPDKNSCYTVFCSLV